METKDLERFKENLQVVIDGYESRLRKLKSEIKELKSENIILNIYNDNLEAKIKYLNPDYGNLKSLIEYFECQNKELIIKNDNLESDVMDYKVRIGLFD